MINFSPLHIYMFEPFPTGRSISSTSQMFAVFYLRPWPYPYIKWSVGCNRQSIHFSIHCRLVLWNKYVASNGGVKDSQPPLVPARANWYPPQWRRKSEVSANGGHFWVSPQPPERAGQQDICGTALLVLANPQTDFSFWFCGFNGRFTGS